MVVTAENLIIGGKYNFQNQPERLVYLGKDWGETCYWHQFAKVGSLGAVWADVLDSDLCMFEETAYA